MAGLVPAIHVLTACQSSWMPALRPGMTELGQSFGRAHVLGAEAHADQPCRDAP
jgi:hypothetical protein